MILERLPEPIDALLITEAFSDEELSEITDEIRLLSNVDASGNGVWLNDVYTDLDKSKIHSITLEKIFSPDVFEHLLAINSMYGLYANVNNHSTIVRYYGQGQSSVLRFDAAAFTAMTFVFDEPKNFSGGETTLQIGGDVAYEHPLVNNSTIVFPSSYYVGLSEVTINDTDILHSGLSVITSYLFIESR